MGNEKFFNCRVGGDKESVLLSGSCFSYSVADGTKHSQRGYFSQDGQTRQIVSALLLTPVIPQVTWWKDSGSIMGLMVTCTEQSS